MKSMENDQVTHIFGIKVHIEFFFYNILRIYD